MTAIEWLVEQLAVIGQLEIPKGSNAVTSIIDEAKEMEEQQIKTAYGSGIETMRKSFSMSSHIPKRAQEYYNDTFNK